MDGLHPQSQYFASSASALSKRSIRRRGFSPRIPQLEEAAFYSPFPQDNGSLLVPSIRVEDAGDGSLQPQVRLVQSNPSPSPFLPFVQQSATRRVEEHEENVSVSEIDLDAVPLTPRPDPIERTSTISSCATGVSQISRLPSPDFSAPRSYANAFEFFFNSFQYSRSRFTRSDTIASDTRSFETGCPKSSSFSIQEATSAPLDFFRTMRRSAIDRLRMPSFMSARYPTFSSRPQQDRSHSASSSLSFSSVQSHGSTKSTDSGRTFLLSKVDTTVKFTHRWPRPLTIKKIGPESLCTSDAGNANSGGTVLDSFDVGLGFERLGTWSNYKWCLLFSIMSVLGYSVAALVYSILAWYQTWEHADVMLVADADVLVLITLCASLLLLAALVGLTGTLLNSRLLLAVYAILLWPALISLLSVGYISYKRATFALDRKLNLAWSQWYTDLERTVIQDSLRCCGFTDPTHEATFNTRCYPRTPRPGCKGPLLRFERANLNTLWHAAFATTPLHILNVVASLLCANNVTRTFGKGLTPRQYRLRAEDVRANAHSLLEHFAKDGAARMPPPMARTEYGLRYNREDREGTHERVILAASSRPSLSNFRKGCP